MKYKSEIQNFPSSFRKLIQYSIEDDVVIPRNIVRDSEFKFQRSNEMQDQVFEYKKDDYLKDKYGKRSQQVFR